MMEERNADHDLLVRIDERTKNWESTLAGFVTRKEFTPVRNVVFGFIGILSITVFGAILSLVLK